MSLFTATSEVDISASRAQVWEALTDPGIVAKYLFGTKLETTWEPGSPIRWSGEFGGKQYDDHGEVLVVRPEEELQVTHVSGDDLPEHQHTVTWQLRDEGDHTHVRLEQDNNASEDERSRAESTWGTVLANLKECVERG